MLYFILILFAVAFIFIVFRIFSGGLLGGRGKPLLFSRMENIVENNKEHLEKMADVKGDLLARQTKKTIEQFHQSANIAKPSEPAIKIRCQSCGHLNDETDKFCGECGAKM